MRFCWTFKDNVPTQPALKIKPQSKLNQARVIDRVIDYPETGGSIDVLLSLSATKTVQVELRMVEELKELSPELQIHRLSQRKVFDYRKISVDKTRAINRSAGGGAEFAGRGLHEGAGVEPVLQRMYS